MLLCAHVTVRVPVRVCVHVFVRAFMLGTADDFLTSTFSNKNHAVEKRNSSAFQRPSTVDGDLDESLKRSASDRLGDLVPQVRARTSPGVFHDMALLGLCLELSFNVPYCRTQANPPTL